MFTEQDTACIRAHGLTPEAVERQLENFRRGFPFLKVVRAAAPGDGAKYTSKNGLSTLKMKPVSAVILKITE